jgi:hypothetical protein
LYATPLGREKLLLSVTFATMSLKAELYGLRHGRGKVR